MFSTGQWMFALFFVIAFIAAITYSYRKDIRLHKKYYKDSFWVLIGFLIFVGVLIFVKSLLKN
ncbi:hypothetical protein ULMS_12670 [Patiriisocius marinistellae]|uniref:Uncharacterized protein n=1 Tax=Patiriisocius marinistellae TaxID=2494560 RepID=A0A5J4FZW7_9FLAO|nr:hypothetical protein ULMS_12670 [Patiriisocius marinistellae]